MISWITSNILFETIRFQTPVFLNFIPRVYSNYSGHSGRVFKPCQQILTCRPTARERDRIPAMSAQAKARHSDSQGIFLCHSSGDKDAVRKLYPRTPL